MPADCLACRISCKHESYMITGRPEGCPLEEAKTGDLISRADAIEAICNKCGGCDDNHDECWEITALKALPSAVCDDCIWHVCNYNKVDWDAPSAEATCATCADRALCIMSAPDGNWKACKDYRPSAEAVQGEWIDIDNNYRLATCSHCHKVTMFEKWGDCTQPYNFCPNCGARMKGADNEID